ncbi:MAG: CRISPR-associated endonuclease Cas2 [Chloroflexi bacterium]|nr:CRISPR-associated endonuclease Cas2 [Chloroflexota bacterium]
MALNLGVLAYDIADDRRRTLVHRLLEEYGVPVQESVFVLDQSPARWEELKKRLLHLVKRSEDDVRVWLLCAACETRAQVWSGPTRLPPGLAAIV